MIVTQTDIAEYESELRAYEDDTRWLRLLGRAREKFGPDAPLEAVRWVVKQLTPKQIPRMEKRRHPTEILAHFQRHPQVLVPSGFDEVRIEPQQADELARALNDDLQNLDGPVSAPPSEYASITAIRPVLEVLLGLRCRETASGRWLRCSGFNFDTQELRFSCRRNDEPVLLLGLRKILTNCERALSSAAHPAVLLLPSLWYPPEERPRIELADTTRALLTGLSAEAIQLRELRWQDFEEVVTELLRSRGLQVHRTQLTHDGGRDIIARGELIPGEPTTLAIEVKHKEIVGIDEVRSRLQANKEFPVIMIATSGRFTAGVIKEKKKPENFLRLLLKDGNAIRDWIASYTMGSRPTLH